MSTGNVKTETIAKWLTKPERIYVDDYVPYLGHIWQVYTVCHHLLALSRRDEFGTKFYATVSYDQLPDSFGALDLKCLSPL